MLLERRGYILFLFILFYFMWEMLQVSSYVDTKLTLEQIFFVSLPAVKYSLLATFE